MVICKCMIIYDSIETRFWKKVKKTDTCWLWQGKTMIVEHDGAKYSMHRYSYQLHFGPIERYDYIRQTCGNTHCVNPAQLYLVDENVRFWLKVQKLSEPNGCWVWLGGMGPNGYGIFHLATSSKKVPATHYSWELWTSRPVPKGILLCHKCDHPYCVNPEHLFLGTHKDNMRDMKDKRRSASGIKHHAHKLTENDIHTIRSSTLTCRVLSKQYG